MVFQVDNFGFEDTRSFFIISFFLHSYFAWLFTEGPFFTDFVPCPTAG